MSRLPVLQSTTKDGLKIQMNLKCDSDARRGRLCGRVGCALTKRTTGFSRNPNIKHTQVRSTQLVKRRVLPEAEGLESDAESHDIHMTSAEVPSDVQVQAATLGNFAYPLEESKLCEVVYMRDFLSPVQLDIMRPTVEVRVIAILIGFFSVRYGRTA